MQLGTYASSTCGGTVCFDAAKFGPGTAGPSTLTAGSIASGGSIVLGAPNKVTVSGTFTQTSTGVLDLQLGGTPASGQYGAPDDQRRGDPGGNAQGRRRQRVWQYGKTQDTAQSQSATGASGLAATSTNLTLNGKSFSYSFPAYSMTVLDLKQAPTVVTPAAATPNPVTGTTTNLSALGTETGGGANLTYTWAATALPSGAAAPTFSANASNAAKNTTATFTKAGTYTLQVTIADPGGSNVTSSVSATVYQTLTSIVVSPAAVSLSTGATQQLMATACDQFGMALAAQPAISWTATVGKITAAGLFTASGTPTTDSVTAASGDISGSRQVTIVSKPAKSAANDPLTAAMLSEAAVSAGTSASSRQVAWQTSFAGVEDWLKRVG